jgi:hypothetical protein
MTQNSQYVERKKWSARFTVSWGFTLTTAPYMLRGNSFAAPSGLHLRSLKVTVATCLAFPVSVNNCAVANMLTAIVEHRTALGR